MIKTMYSIAYYDEIMKERTKKRYEARIQIL